jgi:hypothetical protein
MPAAGEGRSHPSKFYGTQLGRKGTQMADQHPFQTEIEQILRMNTRSHFAKRFLGMQKGLTDVEMAEETARAGEGVQLERIAYVREPSA